MNNPGLIPVNVEDERAWLKEYRDTTNLSWKELGEKSGIPAGTLSQFVPGSYKGDNENIARKVVQFRQTVSAQAELAVEAPEIPGFIKTKTAGQIMQLLAWAHRGRMVVITGGPGIGKTMTAGHYADSASNVWHATMSQSTAGLNPMQIEVLAAMGEKDAVGTPQKLSRRIRDRVKGRDGLIIIDEAQALTEKSVEEIRSWHDATGVGVCLMGNESVLMRLEGGSRKAAYAQLYSRVGMRMIRPLPLHDDAVAIAEGWNITDAKQIDFLIGVASKPGGLRSCTMVLELATMLAVAENNDRNLSHLKDAWAQLSTRPIAA